MEKQTNVLTIFVLKVRLQKNRNDAICEIALHGATSTTFITKMPEMHVENNTV